MIQYSDQTKVMARANRAFGDNDPDRMRALVTGHGYEVHEEDLTSLWHSSLIRFGPPASGSATPGATPG